MSQRLVQQLQQEAQPVRRVCELLKISWSGFYEARQRQEHEAPIDPLRVHVKAVFNASYGSRRVVSELAAKGIAIGRYRVRRLMREQGLRVC